jgi:cation:H+ antiporter
MLDSARQRSPFSAKWARSDLFCQECIAVEYLLDSWSLVVILLCAFVIGWAAETAQTFMSRALALSLLAWLQTLPEFAVEASIAWSQQKDLMIANLTGSLRLLVGLGWPMIFFTHFFFQGVRRKKVVREIRLDRQDAMSVLFLFLSVLYFLIVLGKASLSCVDSVFLTIIYAVYLIILMKMPVGHSEEPEDLPWIGKKIMRLTPPGRILSTVSLFVIGGIGLYVSVHPFIDTLQKWAVAIGISTFVFIQWVAPFLSEFPEKVSAFNWARQESKAPMAIMNMVGSNINQWTMLAAMVPIVYNLSLGHFEPVYLDHMHRMELALTVAQSLLGGVLLLDMRFSLMDALIIFILWIVQFVSSDLREEVAIIYLVWCAWEICLYLYNYSRSKEVPPALAILYADYFRKK